jgi:hypothetical protein
MAKLDAEKIQGGFGQTFGEIDPISGQPLGSVDPKLQSEIGKYQRGNTVRGVSTTRAHQAAQLGGTTCYIYNISPIFAWERRLNNFGIFRIPKAPSVGSFILDHKTKQQRKATQEDIDGAYKLSEPLIINHSYVRTFAGEGKLQPYIDYGEDIAEDICGCSSLYPPDLNSNKDLTKKGVFIVYGKRFEECSEEEQNELLAKAEMGHRDVCREKVVHGDQLHETAKTKGGRGGPLEVHRQCANYLHSRGFLDLSNIPWVINRAAVYKTPDVQKDCVHCYSKINAKASTCPICRKSQGKE